MVMGTGGGPQDRSKTGSERAQSRNLGTAAQPPLPASPSQKAEVQTASLAST